MGERKPATQTMNATNARQRFGDVLGRVAREEARVVVERGGVAVAAIVSPADLARLDRYDAERDARFAGLSRISNAFADVPIDELEREVAQAIAETRADVRATPSSFATSR